MTWQSVSIALVCGCPGAGAWDATYPGDEQDCATHGPTEVQRVSRIYENRRGGEHAT